MKTAKMCMTVAILLAVAISTAQASLVTFVTPTGSTAGGNPVKASVTFTTTNGDINIVIANLLADPGSVGQCISSIRFSVDASLTGATLLSSSCTNVNVASNGTYALGAVVSAGWPLSITGGQILLNDLSGGQPKHTILGPPNGSNLYASANNSITGNGPHNPFADDTATFDVGLPAVTGQSTISNVILGFGTTAGSNVTLTTSTPVPEPATLCLLGLGGAFLFVKRRRSRK